jgi:hypothetical protein
MTEGSCSGKREFQVEQESNLARGHAITSSPNLNQTGVRFVWLGCLKWEQAVVERWVSGLCLGTVSVLATNEPMEE